jgi:hypothetical protein
MKPIDRQKVCPNCDGRVAYDATQCPYCFAVLRAEAAAPILKSTAPSDSFSADSFSALYTPPSSKPVENVYTPKEIPIESAPQSFWPLLALVVAGNLLTLSLLQFFFSDHGVVQLEINASYWFLILLVALPLFYLGWKNFAKDLYRD